MNEHRVNWGRVFLGGVLATVVVGVLGFVVQLLFLRGTMAGDAYLLAPTAGSIALWIGAVYGISTFGVWLYAAIRPRYGPGPGTAVLAGLAVWVITSLTDLLWMMVLSQGADGGALGSVVAAMSSYIVIFPLAIMAGAWRYTEPSPAESSPGTEPPATR